jgi:hypothetical protein
MKPSKALQAIVFCIENNFNLLLKGRPGVAKTDLVNLAGKMVQADVVVSYAVLSDPTDYKGLPFVINKNDQKGAEFLPFGDMERLLDAEKLTVFFLDDFGQASPLVQASAMNLLLSRTINNEKISDHVRFIAATNRRKDKAHVSGILEPVKSRFTTIIEVDSDTEDWINWGLENNMPSELLSFIRFRPSFLHEFTPTQDIINSPCPRTIANVGKMMKAGLSIDSSKASTNFNDNKTTSNQLQGADGYEIIKGACGEGFACELISFLRIVKELPNVDLILKNPDSYDIPTEPSVLYALCGALIDKIDTKNFNQASKFIDRLSVEFALYIIKSLFVKNRELALTEAFIKWQEKNSEYLYVKE